MYVISGPIGLATSQFACTTTACYGVDTAGAADKTFRQLQTQINAFSSLVGFSKLAVDGNIGSSTRTALRKIADYVFANMAAERTNAAQLAAYTNSNKDLASNVENALSLLSREAGLFRLAQTTPIQQTTSTQPSGSSMIPKFSCNNSICFSSDGQGAGKGTDGLFRQMQTLLNAFSSKTGIAVKADGFIGSGTVSAAKAVAAYIKRAAPEDIAVVGVLELNAFSREMLAKTAQSTVDLLVREASKLGVMPNTGVTVTVPVHVPPTQTTFPPVVPEPGTTPSFPAAAVTSSFEAVKEKWPYYLGGAALAGGLVYLIWTFTDEPKKPALQGPYLDRVLARARRDRKKRRSSVTGFDRRNAYGR